MNTNFFTQMGNLNLKQITISMSFSAEDIMVSILPKSNSDDGKKIQELNLTATAQELDDLFFEKITEPMTATKTFFSNIEQYNNSLKKAEDNSAHKKSVKDNVKALVTELNKLISNNSFNPLKEHKIAIEKANSILKLDANNKDAKKVLADMKPYNEPNLFQ